MRRLYLFLALLAGLLVVYSYTYPESFGRRRFPETDEQDEPEPAETYV